MSRSRPIGSITAPDRMCAPTSEPFSTTTTEMSAPFSAASCFSRIAVARPAGPAPTTTTSNAIDSRSGSSIAPLPFIGSGQDSSHMNYLDFGHKPAGLQLRAEPWPSVVAESRTAYITRMADGSPNRAALESLLDFYVEAGVDCAIDEAPHDRFAEAACPAPASPVVERPAPRPAAL